MKIEFFDFQCGIIGYSVGLVFIFIWVIREVRLYNLVILFMIFNFKLDGRFFVGDVKCYIQYSGVGLDQYCSSYQLFSVLLLLFFIIGVDSVMFLLLFLFMNYNFDDYIYQIYELCIVCSIVFIFFS